MSTGTVDKTTGLTTEELRACASLAAEIDVAPVGVVMLLASAKAAPPQEGSKDKRGMMFSAAMQSVGKEYGLTVYRDEGSECDVNRALVALAKADRLYTRSGVGRGGKRWVGYIWADGTPDPKASMGGVPQAIRGLGENAIEAALASALRGNVKKTTPTPTRRGRHVDETV